MKNKVHAIRIFSLMFLLIVGFLVARTILLPKSFGEHGTYRWDAIKDAQALPVVNQNVKTCKECHENIYQLHEKDAHYSVPCVDCHGAGNVHVAFYKSGDTTNAEEKKKAFMPKEFNFEGCLFCHRKLKARPVDFPQINQEEHYKFLHITDNKTKCIECHNPHEPIFLLTEVGKSRIHPIINRCTDCHNKKPEKDFRQVADHPAIFECKDCHSEIVKDFESRPHAKYIDCRTCHLYHKENETTGRIYKNGNAKFCLLCHEKKPFKDDKYPPKIEWPAHVGNLSIIKYSDEKICLNCHADKIHHMDTKPKENPHPESWRMDHKEYAKSEKQICMGCHSTNQCSSCHMQNKPASHGPNWKKEHPDFGKKNKSSCDFCHTPNSCIGCHKVEIPHPKDWEEKHQDVVKQKGQDICKKCHAEDFCKTCH